MSAHVYISLGSNLGDKKRNIQAALAQLAAVEQVEVIKSSSLYRTKAWGYTAQPDFINAVVLAETELQPLALLQILQQIEIKLGRRHDRKWGPRSIDLDILLWDQDIIDRPDLKVPHPYMRERAFVLVPLAEIAPGLMLAGGTKVEEVLEQISDREGGYIEKI